MVAICATIAAVLAASSPGGKPGSSAGWSVHASHGHEVRLPATWHLARERLVPKLLRPREVLSVGTGPLPVGGGGNCGAYPVEALDRMGRDDRLITIQRRPGDLGTRWFESIEEWPLRISLPPASRGVRDRWTSELLLRRGGDLYSVLVAFGRRPTPATIAQAERILRTIRVV
jgi:hypothetical protein